MTAVAFAVSLEKTSKPHEEEDDGDDDDDDDDDDEDDDDDDDDDIFAAAHLAHVGRIAFASTTHWRISSGGSGQTLEGRTAREESSRNGARLKIQAVAIQIAAKA